MQNSPVTFDERLSAIGGVFVVALVIFGIATLLQYAIGKTDERKRIQGRPVRWWVTALFTIGAITGALIADNSQYYLHEIVGGLGGFGILGGLLAGNVHGGINLMLKPDTATVRDDNPDSSGEEGRSRRPEDGNPYSPPTQR
ncbi:hypothetical protein [Rhodopirellula europaea]|uniref:hypothetical protein n=1 Tax=Rhodopirellula europaea TaxID=1263866 RepID=UPI00055D3816|nr:hypothetical protein [Rhodopirellula europaea]